MPDAPPPAHSPFQPLHVILAAYPIACFSAAFLSDIAYMDTAEMQWANFSAWLIFGGLAMGVLSAIVGIVDFLFLRRRQRATRPYAWVHHWGTALVLLLSLFNAMVHSRDAYTSVVPTGIILSGIVTVLVLVTSWVGATISYSPRGDVA